MAERYFASTGGDPAREVVVEGDTVRLGGSDAATVRGLPGGRAIVELEGRSAVGFAERRDGVWHVEVQGRLFRVRVDDERMHRIRELTAEVAPAGGAAELRAPMPGLVVRVAVTPGDEVRAGQAVVTMEAMKMENELRAERAGVVAAVHVAEGETVDRDDPLVSFEPDPDLETG